MKVEKVQVTAAVRDVGIIPALAAFCFLAFPFRLITAVTKLPFMAYTFILRDVFHRQVDSVSVDGSPEQALLWALHYISKDADLQICEAELFDPRFKRFVYRVSVAYKHPALEGGSLPLLTASKKVSLNPQLSLAL